jgi:hypothetical protein
MWTPTTRQQHSRTVTPIPDRSDRRRVARDRAALAEALRDGPTARVADARDHQRHLLRNSGGPRVQVHLWGRGSIREIDWQCTGSGSEIRRAPTTQPSAVAGFEAEPGAGTATSAAHQAGNESGVRCGMKPSGESQIYELQFWSTYITRKFGKLLPMVDTHRNS